MSIDETLFAAAEADAVNRKKALLGVLARKVAEAEGLAPDAAEVAAHTRAFRQAYGLSEDAAFQAWLRACGLDAKAFASVMRTHATVEKLERVLADELGAHAEVQRRVWTARSWLQSRGP